MIYKLFISHAWNDDSSYQGVCRLLDSVPQFEWRDYSAPVDYPICDPEDPVLIRDLKAKIDEQIRQCSCFLSIAGMTINTRRWIKYEIERAINREKPIVGIRRRGQENTPRVMHDFAREIVNWNSKSIANAIIRQVGG